SLFAGIPLLTVAQDSKTVLMNMVKAMGVENVRTLYVIGTGSHAVSVGQNRNPNASWPVARVKAYTRQMDLEAGRSSVQLVQVQNGADETLNEYISADSPWNSQFSFWLTPVGFIKGALANNATVSSSKLGATTYTAVTFRVHNQYKDG